MDIGSGVLLISLKTLKDFFLDVLIKRIPAAKSLGITGVSKEKSKSKRYIDLPIYFRSTDKTEVYI